ncbi:glycosyltransferase family 9 protein [Chitinophaga sp. OAE865]|uniref:glycosyltransferase family 9 protein n=1 Tax=Chitinophaga sp. OAE865 TaxID=2817898 RepID=UPI001AE4A129
MNVHWKDCKKILCIRLDNMGDLLMSTPAFRALKESFHCHLALLTSAAAAPVTADIPEIDQVIIFNAPWVKHDHVATPETYRELVETLRKERFDAAIIFTVYSQNPLPAAMLAFEAGIPLRLAYCRENPYQLLSHWIPDEEPLHIIHHQVERDLNLAAYAGAEVISTKLSLQTHETHWPGIIKKMRLYGADHLKPWIVMHPMVQDAKRQYNFHKWVEIGRQVIARHQCQLLITGNTGEEADAETLKEAIGEGAVNLAGTLSVAEFALLIRKSPLVISVNTGTIHIAAATGTPVVVLYALTNLQHTPWRVRNEVLYFDVPPALQSRNVLLQYSYHRIPKHRLKKATVENVLKAVDKLLQPAGSSTEKKPGI